MQLGRTAKQPAAHTAKQVGAALGFPVGGAAVGAGGSPPPGGCLQVRS